jgi:hypothetical protein
MILQRLVLSFKPGEASVEVRTLYRTQDGPNPGTKARSREVTALAREGLREALETLEGRVDVVGESGYDVREDVIVAETDRHRKGAR